MNIPSRTRLIVLLLLALLLIGLISFAGAKYVTTITHHATITFSASLAENVILQEHKAVRQTDGCRVGGEASSRASQPWCRSSPKATPTSR